MTSCFRHFEDDSVTLYFQHACLTIILKTDFVYWVAREFSNAKMWHGCCGLLKVIVLRILPWKITIKLTTILGNMFIFPTTKQANQRSLPDSVENVEPPAMICFRSFWKNIIFPGRPKWGVFRRFGLWANLFALPDWCAHATKTHDAGTKLTRHLDLRVPLNDFSHVSPKALLIVKPQDIQRDSCWSRILGKYWACLWWFFVLCFYLLKS